MVSFELAINGDWQEVLQGGTFLAFDSVSANRPEMYFSESATAPVGVDGVFVATWPQGWDFEGSGFEAGSQRIWLRGVGIIRGVRK